MTDLYGELGIERDADEKEIRKAYRRRAKTAHPNDVVIERNDALKLLRELL